MGNRLQRASSEGAEEDVEAGVHHVRLEATDLNDRDDDAEEDAEGDDDEEEEDERNDLYPASRYRVNPRVSSESDSFIFHVRPEIAALISNNFLGRMQTSPSVHTTSAVKCLVNIRKESLALVPHENAFRLQFTVDSLEDCAIRVFLLANESYDANTDMLTFANTTERTFPVYSLKKGLEQSFTVPPEDALDLSAHKQEELEATAGCYPLIIEATASDPPTRKHRKSIHTQITYARFVKSGETQWSLKVLKVKIKYHDSFYVVHDVFGVDYQTTEGGTAEETQGRECVICMTDPRDTTILPCRHMCLCGACAEVLRTQTNKCPICRSHVKALLSLRRSSCHKGKAKEAAADDEPLQTRQK